MTPLSRKHIITPVYNMPEGVPLALVAWGCRLEMTEVDPDKVKKFIRERGLQGGIANEVLFLNRYCENYRETALTPLLQGMLAKEGQYDEDLLQLAQTVPGSDYNDTVLCPEMFHGVWLVIVILLYSFKSFKCLNKVLKPCVPFISFWYICTYLFTIHMLLNYAIGVELLF